MNKFTRFAIALCLIALGCTTGYAATQKSKKSMTTDVVKKEKTLYKTNFQEWEKLSASTTATEVVKQMTTGANLTFTLFNTAVDPAGTNSKFTNECCTAGYLQTNKDATNVPYILTSPIKSVTTLSLVQAATGGTRGITLAVKGDGDADWVMLHNKTVGDSKGEVLTFDINRANCQIKIGTLAPSQNAYVLSMEIKGMVEEAARTFTDFAIDFTSNPYTVTKPATGALPEGVTVNGSWHDSQHGYNTTTLTVPVDGPVKIKFGNCQYSGTPAIIKNGDTELARVACTKGCDGETAWTYNVEAAATLTITTPQYCPSISVEACDFIPEVTVSYFNTDGSLIGEEVVGGGSELKFKYSAEDLNLGLGVAFRGWFDSKLSTGSKVKEGIALTEDTRLYAHATPLEIASSTARYEYDLTKTYFYVEDHECIDIDGTWHDGQHGWTANSIKLWVAEKAYITVGTCVYSNESTATVTDPNGKEVASFPVKADADGAEQTFRYDGPSGWITITFPKSSYTHKVSIWNVVDFLEFNETTGYYEVPANDASSFLLALKSANGTGNTKIYLPKGTYNLGQTCLTAISGKNISIIGESMENTIIVNAPLPENEGIGTTATLYNTSDGLYLQDLTIWNNMTFNGGTGRAVCLQDKGKNTICKNVKLLSYQDTYYSNAASRFYWEDSEIHGVVDYICGDGDVVYNRVKFVNEEIKNTTIAAPYTSASCKWGYVMLDCEIETLCKEFNFGRSWGGDSKLQYIRTKILNPEKLVSTRFTTSGMNIAAYKFKEYQSTDANGNIITPASNVLKFTHSTGDKEYETVLTADEAATYTLENIYGTWAPNTICAQAEVTEGEISAPQADATYLVDGKIYVGTIPAGAKSVRKANARGGFGPAFGDPSAISSVIVTELTDAPIYNIAGQRVAQNAKGILIQNGIKHIVR